MTLRPTDLMHSIRLRAALLASFTVLAGASAAHAQWGEGVKVVSSDPQGMVLEVTPTITTGKLATGEILPAIPGAIVTNFRSLGEPMRMSILVPVALPAATGSSVEVLAAQYDAPVAGRIAPVPEMRQDDRGIVTPVYTINAAAYARPMPAQPAAELSYQGIARDVHAGAVAIAPYQYDPYAQSIRFLRSVRLRVRYGGSAGVSGSREPLSAMTRMSFPNAAAAEGWSLAKRNMPILARRSTLAQARAWMRVEVKKEGLYDLTAEDFRKAGIDLATVDPAKIAIYGGNGGGMPESIWMADSNTMRQIPVIVEKGSDGKASHVLFYGVGPYTWGYTFPNDLAPQHALNPYVTSNSYIVAVDGEDSRGFDRGGSGGDFSQTVVSGISRIFTDEERYNAVDVRKGGGSGRDWFGTEFQVDGSRTSDPKVFSNRLSWIDRSMPVLYRVRVANAGRSGTSRFDVKQKDTRLGASIAIAALDGENIARAESDLFQGNASDIPSDDVSLLGITYTNPSAATGYLDWYEIHYGRFLKAEGDQLLFDAPPGSGVAQFIVSDFSSNDLRGFDVTDPVNPKLLQSEAGDNRFVFRDALRSGSATRRYFVTTRGAARRVDNVTAASFGNLRDRMLNADILVITHPDFKSVADAYVAYRNGLGMRAAAVTTDEIYTEFSHGNLDPTALRDYVAFAMRNWPTKPTHVLLIGDASYDYRNIVSKQKQYVPIWQSDDGSLYDHVDSKSVDDFFVRVIADSANNDPADLAIGRFPIETVEQGNVILGKIRRYEESKNFGLWRQDVTLAADDDIPIGDGGGFTGQSEVLWRSYIPKWLESRKIYLGNYPTDKSSSISKPGAVEDLSDAIERGSLITNWVGHGNPDVWAHEHLLEKENFIPRLTNDSVLTYVPAATCNFGYLDEPAHISGGELFLLHPSGGAVGVMTATRAVLISNAQTMMYNHFRALFTRDPGTLRYPTLGQALVMSKRYGSSDDDKFLLIGDPAMRLNLPQDSVEVTQINVTDVRGDSMTSGNTATIGALSLVTVEGRVLDHAGAERGDFNGTAIVSLFDADRVVKVNAGEYITNVTYYGGRLFRGPAQVTNGRFRINFRVPKDIAYDTATGRVHVYAYNAQGDAAGMTNRVRIYGSDTATITDKTGPTIKLFMDDRSFRSGDLVTAKPMLMVDLADSSGINSSGSSIGHRIEAWVDNNPKSIDLTDSYQTLPTDYREGTAQRRLLNLEPGEHSLRVRAWDIYNNSSEASATFRITSEGDKTLKVEDVVNYPNPMSRETDFLFRHNQSSPLDVEITIFTVSGRKVRTLESPGVRERFVRVHWDGTDADGSPLANGVYLYRLRVKKNAVATTGELGSEEQNFETIEKVAIVR